jgi:hypothetical protein
LDQLRIYVTGEQEGSAGVPEVMPADGGEARCFEERFEVAIDHVLGVQGGALARSENEVWIPVIGRPKLLRAGACGGF